MPQIARGRIQRKIVTNIAQRLQALLGYRHKRSRFIDRNADHGGSFQHDQKYDGHDRKHDRLDVLICQQHPRSGGGWEGVAKPRSLEWGTLRRPLGSSP